jgi:hypothetical protein
VRNDNVKNSSYSTFQKWIDEEFSGPYPTPEGWDEDMRFSRDRAHELLNAVVTELSSMAWHKVSVDGFPESGAAWYVVKKRGVSGVHILKWYGYMVPSWMQITAWCGPISEPPDDDS